MNLKVITGRFEVQGVKSGDIVDAAINPEDAGAVFYSPKGNLVWIAKHEFEKPLPGSYFEKNPNKSDDWRKVDAAKVGEQLNMTDYYEAEKRKLEAAERELEKRIMGRFDDLKFNNQKIESIHVKFQN